MSAITILRDLRSQFGPARDQSGRETCLAFAMSDAHSFILGKPWKPLSCEYLFYHAKLIDKGPAHEGTTVSAARSALENEGQPEETGWPYLHSTPTNLKAWKPPSTIKIIYRRKSKAKVGLFGQIWDSIESGTPVVVGMTISTAFYSPTSDAVVDVVEPEEPVGHAVIAVAIGEQKKKRLILIRNSWGDTWGQAGYAWLSEEYAAKRFMVAVTLI
jgi:C1A family cysteine protease